MGYLAVRLTNENEMMMVVVDALNIQGDEQWDVGPQPLQAQVFVDPCYVTTVKVDFMDGDGRVVHSGEFPFPATCVLHPRQHVVGLVMVTLPKVPGTYAVKVHRVEQLGTSRLGRKEDQVKPPGVVTLQDVEIPDAMVPQGVVLRDL